jgi:hypothetical protein
VLEYFSHSMFWDRQSDNQALVMQMQFSGARPADIAEELRTYVLFMNRLMDSLQFVAAGKEFNLQLSKQNHHRSLLFTS